MENSRSERCNRSFANPPYRVQTLRNERLLLRIFAEHRPLHVLIDSTGLEVFGAGQWLEAKHGAKSRRTWRKLHLAVDADSGMIVAQALTDQQTDDPSQVGPLRAQIDEEIGQVMAVSGVLKVI